MTAGRRSTALRIAGACAGVACGVTLSVWEGTTTRDTATTHASVLAVIALAAAVALAVGRHRQRARTRAWVLAGVRRARGHGFVEIAGVAGWVVLICATIGWDLWSFSQGAPHLPTLSRLVGDVTRHEWGRALVFALWLTLGAVIALGWRRAKAR